MRKIGLAVFFSFTMSSMSQVLMRQPYIQKLAQNTVTIGFKSDVSATGGVEYGLTDSLGSNVTESAPLNLHGIGISGLIQDTQYFYQITLNGFPATTVLSFKTAKDISIPIFSFNAIGDVGGGDLPNCQAVAAQFALSTSDFGLIIGDLVYPAGADSDYDPKYFSNYQAFNKARCNYTAIGNHEFMTNSGQPYDDNLFCFNDNSEGSERYYTFHYGNALFICLDPVTHDYGPSQPITQWLAQVLSSSTDFWKFAFFHYPPYSCCSSAGHGSNLSLRAYWSPIFEQYNLDFAFSGHDHGYERTNVRKDYYSSSRGVVYYVTGGGGYSLYAWNTNCAWTAYTESTDEFLRVEVLGARLRTCGIKPDGTIFDCTNYLKSDIPFNLYKGIDPTSLTLYQSNVTLAYTIADGIPPDGVVFYYQMDGPIIIHLEKTTDGTTTIISHQDFQ